MKNLFWKISAVLLFAACLILTIDKTRMGLRMNGITSRIAEKSRIIADNEKKYKQQLEALRTLIREKDRRFHVALYSGELPFQLLPADSGDEKKFVKKTVKQVKQRTPEELKNVFLANYKEQYENKEVFYLLPETGNIHSRFAALLESSAAAAGMNSLTELIWDPQTKQLYSETVLSSRDKKNPVSAAVSSPRGTQTQVNAPIRQTGPVTTVFPFFRQTGPDAKEETVLLNEQSSVPCGGNYVHYFELEGSLCLLDYEAENPETLEAVNLRALSLSGTPVRSHTTGSICTFLVKPGADGKIRLLVIADTPFFPVRITAAPVKEQ